MDNMEELFSLQRSPRRPGKDIQLSFYPMLLSWNTRHRNWLRVLPNERSSRYTLSQNVLPGSLAWHSGLPLQWLCEICKIRHLSAISYECHLRSQHLLFRASRHITRHYSRDRHWWIQSSLRWVGTMFIWIRWLHLPKFCRFLWRQGIILFWRLFPGMFLMPMCQSHALTRLSHSEVNVIPWYSARHFVDSEWRLVKEGKLVWRKLLQPQT